MTELERPLMYFLDERGEPVGVDHADAFSDPRMREWYDSYRMGSGPSSRRVAQTTVNDYWVSTVFLSIDHHMRAWSPRCDLARRRMSYMLAKRQQRHS